MRSYQELSHRKSTESASVSVGRLGPSTEPPLVIPAARHGQGIGDIDAIPHNLNSIIVLLLSGQHGVCRRQQDMTLRRSQVRDPNWEDRLVHGWRHAHEVNQVRTPLPGLSERFVRWVIAARQLIAQQSGSTVQVRRFGILVAVPPVRPDRGTVVLMLSAALICLGLKIPFAWFANRILSPATENPLRMACHGTWSSNRRESCDIATKAAARMRWSGSMAAEPAERPPKVLLRVLAGRPLQRRRIISYLPRRLASDPRFGHPACGPSAS